MGNESLNPGKWLNLLLSEPYYLFHFLTFFSYFIIRSPANHSLALHLAHRLLRWEIQMLLVFALLAFLKGVKEETWETFIPDALFLAKMCLFSLAYTMDRCLAIWYILVFLVLYMLAQQPPFEESGTSNKLTPLQLESLLTEGKTSRFWQSICAFYGYFCKSRCPQFPWLKKKKRCPKFQTLKFVSWLPSADALHSNAIQSFLFFYLAWIRLKSMSNSKEVRVKICSIVLVTRVGEKFGISLGGSMSHLPTFILFDNATEVSRYPELDFEGKYFQPTITKGLLARHFELDRHLLDYVNGK